MLEYEIILTTYLFFNSPPLIIISLFPEHDRHFLILYRPVELLIFPNVFWFPIYYGNWKWYYLSKSLWPQLIHTILFFSHLPFCGFYQSFPGFSCLWNVLTMFVCCQYTTRLNSLVKLETASNTSANVPWTDSHLSFISFV